MKIAVYKASSEKFVLRNKIVFSSYLKIPEEKMIPLLIWSALIIHRIQILILSCLR